LYLVQHMLGIVPVVIQLGCESLFVGLGPLGQNYLEVWGTIDKVVCVRAHTHERRHWRVCKMSY